MTVEGLKRFWDKVDKTGDCWEWIASTTPSGYGKFYINGKIRPAHRLAFEAEYGPIREGMFIDHVCHNPACVNPDHLREATPKQNMENLKGPHTNSRSGVRGVYLDARVNRWYAQVRHNSKPRHIGNFDTKAEAEAAAVAARNALFTHNDSDRQELTR